MKSKLYTLLVFSVVSLNLLAQSPGGVTSDLTMWIRANAGTSTTGGLVDTWNYSNNGNSFTSTGASRPTLVTSSVNFLPSLSFAGSQIMVGPNGVNAPITAGNDAYAIFGVWLSNTATPTAPQRIWSQTSRNSGEGAGLWIYNNNYGDQAEIFPYTHIAQRPYTNDTWNISQLNLLQLPSSDIEIVDDRNIATAPMIDNTDPGGTPNGEFVRNIATTDNILGQRSIPGPDEGLFGNVAEVIVYNRPVSGAERSRIFSYLAIKYGVTLKTDLLSSAGATVWNATTNATYNNSVFGLALDNGSNLSVTQSNSIETGSGNGTGQSGEANIVISNPSALTTNQTFLLIGNDNGSLTESGTDLPASLAGSQRLGREWKVSHTGNAGTVNLKFDLNGLSTTGASPINYRLVVDEDGDGDFTTGTQRIYGAATYSGGILDFPGAIVLNNNEVFMLVTNISNPLLPVTWISFTASNLNGKAQLNWEVENTDNAKQYEIEYSSNGLSFDKVAIVPSIDQARNYTFNFNVPLANGFNYFRIKQVDKDGKYTYSKIETLSLSVDLSIKLLRNTISNNTVELLITSTKTQPVNIEVWSTTGTRIVSKQQKVTVGATNIQLDINNAAKGNYFIKIQAGNQIVNEKFIKL